MPFAAVALFALAAAAAGCGGEDEPGKGAAGGGSGGSAGAATAGSGGGASPLAGAAGKGGDSAAAGKGGVGGAEPGLPVPRVENTDGDSVLDNPRMSLTDGKCMDGAVFCAGECLTTDLQVAGSCTALKLGLGQTTSLALTADALFYTAANQEILKHDLAAGTHTSLVRGLTFVEALAVDGDWLYFGNEVPDSFFQYDARRVALTGGDVTVLMPSRSEPIASIIPLPDALLVGVGHFDLDLLTVAKAGGPTMPFGDIMGATTPVLGGDTLYYRSDDGISSTSIAAPASGNNLNSEFSNARLILEGDYLYYVIAGVYTRQPIVGGAPEQVQPLEGAGLWGRSPTEIIFTQPDMIDEDVLHVLAMPIAGGTARELVTIEAGELKAVAANASHAYLAVGVTGGGAILRVAL